ncbi:MAG TPA: hypothetical protein VKZ53_20835 [Candidatus Angelobacter sp.]|nr:hypothetical protein [Candidatus Angelobacter sp.]
MGFQRMMLEGTPNAPTGVLDRVIKGSLGASPTVFCAGCFWWLNVPPEELPHPRCTPASLVIAVFGVLNHKAR